MKFIVKVIILGMAFAGCRNAGNPDVKNFRQEVRIQRLDRDLFNRDTLNPDLTTLRERYGRFLDVYTGGVLQLGTVADSGFRDLLCLFLRDSVMREVADTVGCRYPDLQQQERELADAWAYYRYYFPGQKIPGVYAGISGFNQSMIVDTASIGIGLDNYLGEDCWFYDLLAIPIPRYARKKMTDQDIVKDVLMAWLQRQFIFRPLKNDLISGMIYQGKLVYVLARLQPDQSGFRLFGFTPEQWTWCENNEKQIWQFLIENEYVFSTQQRLMLKYLNDAPYTSGMPVESPGKAVVWTGFRVVEKYMEKHDFTLEELMKEQDYHKILRMSGYRP